MSLPLQLTTKHIVQLLDSAHKLFGHGYQFEPERINEGGIRMTKWPDYTSTMAKYPHAYKTMRLGIHGWPWIPCSQHKTIVDKWRDGEAISFTPMHIQTGTGPTYHTFLKAFRGAPCWTLKELALWKQAFESLILRLGSGGVKVIDMPKAKDLETYARPSEDGDLTNGRSTNYKESTS